LTLIFVQLIYPPLEMLANDIKQTINGAERAKQGNLPYLGFFN